MATRQKTDDEVNNDADYLALSEKERFFVDDYLQTWDKTSAARAYGFTNDLRQRGYGVYNRDNVKAYITKKVQQMTSTTDEAVKRVADMAEANLTEYFRDQEYFDVPRVRQPLGLYIAEREEQLYQEKLYEFEAELSGKELEVSQKKIKNMKAAITRLRIELDRNPAAYRVVDGEPVIRTRQVLDLNELVKDKHKVRIKKVKIYKDGAMEVESYNALDANEKLLKMGGRYELDNAQRNPVSKLDTDKLSDETIKDLLKNGGI
jgi:phage terminase small subunit